MEGYAQLCITAHIGDVRSSADPCVAARYATGRLLDLSHICWRTCVADLLAITDSVIRAFGAAGTQHMDDHECRLCGVPLDV